MTAFGEGLAIDLRGGLAATSFLLLASLAPMIGPILRDVSQVAENSMTEDGHVLAPELVVVTTL